MNNNQNNIIQQYLNNELPDKEKLDFEEKIRLDKVLAEEVSIQKLEQEVVTIFTTKDAKDKLNQWKNEEIKRTQQRRWIWSIVIIIGLVLGSIILYNIITQPTEKEENQAIAQKMETELFTYSPFRGESMVETDSILLNLNTKLTAYKQTKDFDAAIQYTRNFIESHPNRTTTNFDLEWIIITLYLKNNNRKQAIFLLEKINSDDEHDYQNKALEILPSLK